MKVFFCPLQPESRDDLVPSPHDIEIRPEESSFPPSDETLTQNFYAKERRYPVLKIDKLRIGSNCFSSQNVVDLKLLRKASPGLLKNVRLGGSKGGDKGATAAGAKKGRKKSEDSATEKKKKEPAKKKPKQPEIKVTINSDSSDDDSDSDLEELRKKMLKPGLKLASSSQSTSGNLILRMFIFRQCCR